MDRKGVHQGAGKIQSDVLVKAIHGKLLGVADPQSGKINRPLLRPKIEFQKVQVRSFKDAVVRQGLMGGKGAQGRDQANQTSIQGGGVENDLSGDGVDWVLVQNIQLGAEIFQVPPGDLLRAAYHPLRTNDLVDIVYHSLVEAGKIRLFTGVQLGLDRLCLGLQIGAPRIFQGVPTAGKKLLPHRCPPQLHSGGPQ